LKKKNEKINVENLNDEKIIQQNQKKMMTIDEASLYYYLRGSDLKELNQFEEATHSLKKCLTYGPEIIDEKWVIPHCFVIFAEMNFQQKEYHLAQLYIEKASLWSKYDFEKHLSVRVNKLVDRIKRLPDPQSLLTI